MKILMFLTKIFVNDPRVYKEAYSLIKAGHQVQIINWARHDIDNKLPAQEEIKGIKIHYIHDSYFIKKIKSPSIKNPFWWIKAYFYSLKIYKTEFKFSAVHCHDLDTLPIGVMCKKKLGVKLIYDAHEIFGLMIKKITLKAISNIAYSMEKSLIKHVDNIITVNEPLADYFYKICKRPITIIMNCQYLVTDKYTPPLNNIFTISYIGTLNEGKMFPQIVDIIGNLKEIKFVIAGKKEGFYSLVKKKAKKYKNIEFLGAISFEQVIPKTLEADIVICMIDSHDPHDQIALANKQFDAMACGRPIIITKNTYAGSLTKKLNCGLVIDYTESALKNAIQKLKNNSALCENLGRNALKAAMDKYNWENEEKKLIELYSKLTHFKN